MSLLFPDTDPIHDRTGEQVRLAGIRNHRWRILGLFDTVRIYFATLVSYMIRQGTIIRWWYDQERGVAPPNALEAVCCIRPSRKLVSAETRT